MKPIFALIFAVTALTAQAGEVEISRSTPGDKGRYFLMDVKKEGSIVKALHRRVGPSGTGYTRTESNCSTLQMREIGYSEDGADKIKVLPTKWFDLVSGSSKSDLFNFVCRK
jgi:hypothetical protein